MNNRRKLVLALGAGALTAPLTSFAQQAGKVYRIGILSAGRFLPELGALFSEGLKELGWIEGKNVVFESRFAEDRLDRLPEFAAELVRLNVDVILTHGTLATVAAKRATTTIPIVMANAGDPLGSGLVASLARPGGNVTGLSMMIPEIAGKWLQILKELVPRLSRVAILWNPANSYLATVFRETEDPARRLGIQRLSLEVRSLVDLRSAFDAAVRQRASALLVVSDTLLLPQKTQIVDFAAKNQLPALYAVPDYVEVGGLMSYGVRLGDLHRRAAFYVDKILKGTKPADLPVEQPTKLELVINGKTAKALGLKIPQSLLISADKIIQ
jgi:putative ABC transport system substrate-binding protein